MSVGADEGSALDVCESKESVTARKVATAILGACCVLFTINEVVLATENFTSRVLGSGGFGKVYLGALAGTSVAIKMCLLEAHTRAQVVNARDNALQELHVLFDLRHDKIIKLLGFAFAENGVPVIITEYMPHNALVCYESGKKKVAPLS